MKGKHKHKKTASPSPPTKQLKHLMQMYEKGHMHPHKDDDPCAFIIENVRPAFDAFTRTLPQHLIFANDKGMAGLLAILNLLGIKAGSSQSHDEKQPALLIRIEGMDDIRRLHILLADAIPELEIEAGATMFFGRAEKDPSSTDILRLQFASHDEITDMGCLIFHLAIENSRTERTDRGWELSKNVRVLANAIAGKYNKKKRKAKK